MFRERGGFDIVLANPPYVRQELITDQKPALKVAYPEVWHGVADLFVYFYARALNLLREGGLFAFISSNKFMRSNYGQGLRGYLLTTTILSVIDFGDTPIFDATTYPAIVIARKQAPKANHQPHALTVRDMETVGQLATAVQERAFPLAPTALSATAWTLEDNSVLALIQKLRDAGQPLGDVVQRRFYRGVTTGYNDAFVIDEATRTALITSDPRSNEVIKPYLRGRNVKRWRTEWDRRYLIRVQNSGDKNADNAWGNTNNENEARRIFYNTYPAVHDHLSQYEEKLRPRSDQGEFWWELRACAYYKEFEQPKIVTQDISPNCQFAFDGNGYYLVNTAYAIIGDKSLLGILNTKTVDFFYRHISSTVRGGYVRFISQYIGQIPIPTTMNNERAAIERLTEQLLEARGIGANVEDTEGEINERVYRLFGLSQEEIRIIEGKE